MYVSTTSGDCGLLSTGDAFRSYWRVPGVLPADTLGYEITVPIHQMLGSVGAAGGTVTFFVNTRKESGAGAHTVPAANIVVTFIPS